MKITKANLIEYMVDVKGEDEDSVKEWVKENSLRSDEDIRQMLSVSEQEELLAYCA